MNWSPSPQNLSQLKKKEISLEAIEHQVEMFKSGFEAIHLSKPATVGDGILQLTNEDKAKYAEMYSHFKGSVGKFVPASGAATRMFKDLMEFYSTHQSAGQSDRTLMLDSEHPVLQFINNLEIFAFYPDLKQRFTDLNDYSLEEGHLKREYLKILEALFDSKSGLNISQLPKGLLKFHKYDEGNRTASVEQLIEGNQHTNGILKVHFTVSPNFQKHFERHIEESIKHLDLASEVTFSIQDSRTDTIAVDSENFPVKDENGNLVFRPAGHGALLENLNQLSFDLVFIKNIDNVLPDRLKGTSITYKKILAGVLIHYQAKAYEMLRKRQEGEEDLASARELLLELGVSGIPQEEYFRYLNRPIRVCGMVKNVGEPGGGPFWAIKDGIESLQIVESSQVGQDGSQQNIFKSATHFNPVDIVCGLTDFEGNKFDLTSYRDSSLGFISEKSFMGQKIKAMELPGLWNGSMADWNTIFVEVPLATFSPVKTINDLLKPEHQG